MKRILISGAVLAFLAGPAFAGSLDQQPAQAGAASGVTAPDRDFPRIEPNRYLPATEGGLNLVIDGWRERVADYENGRAAQPSESRSANAAALSHALAEVELRRALLASADADSYADARSALDQALEDMAIVWDAVSVQT
ncbi:hypothetical protein [Zavarzinia sp. CC-PAN008]|uniref:hypothetical protein n=1 Tax=Zavarzinia sp. CC-PAN008 TaxID=3243332 RepID=UPI003F7453DA